MERVTITNVRRAAAHYAATLAGYGWGRAVVIDIRAPYGRTWYVVTADDMTGTVAHDVPGFTGSGGSGFVTAREGHARILAASHAVADLGRLLGLPFDSDAANVARLAVAERCGVTV